MSWGHRVVSSFAVMLAGIGLAAAQNVVNVDDYGCDGTDQVDDTACWQAALNAAKPSSGFPYYGTVEATSGGNYLVSDTLLVNTAMGGEINGNGAVIHWRRTGDADRPLFLLEDTQQLKIRNLKVRSNETYRLQCAFEFTNNPVDPPSPNSVAPIANLIDHVITDGTNLDGMEYGVRFSYRYSYDANDDQSTIMNSTFNNVTRAAISIEHTQSHQHRFYAVNAYAAAGNEQRCEPDPVFPAQQVCGASFVRQWNGGGFHSIGGFRNGFRNAEYYLVNPYTPITIIDGNSEGCARLINTPSGAAWFPFPVSVLGGRFAVNDVAPDGYIVQFYRQGPLTIRDLAVDGVPPAGTQPLRFLFSPPGPYPGTPFNDAPFELSNLSMYVNGSTGWDPIARSASARIEAHNNMCFDSQFGVMSPCRGLAGGVSGGWGQTFAELSTAALLDGQATYCRDCRPNAATAACEGGGTGAFARREAGSWECSGGEVTPSGAQTLTSKDLSSPTNTFPSHLVTLNGTQVLTGKDLTSTTNSFPETSLVGFSSSAQVSTTNYLGPNIGRSSTTLSQVEVPSNHMVARSLRCRVTTAPGGTNKWSFRVPGGATGTGCSGAGICCEIQGSATSCTATGSYVVTAGTLLSLKALETGSAASTFLVCGLGVGP